MVRVRAQPELKLLNAPCRSRPRNFRAQQNCLIAMEVLEIFNSHPLQHKHSDMSISRVYFQNSSLLHVVAEHCIIIRQSDFSVLCDHLFLSRFTLFVFFSSQGIVVRVTLDMFVKLNDETFLTSRESSFDEQRVAKDVVSQFIHFVVGFPGYEGSGPWLNSDSGCSSCEALLNLRRRRWWLHISFPCIFWVFLSLRLDLNPFYLRLFLFINDLSLLRGFNHNRDRLRFLLFFWMIHSDLFQRLPAR